MLRFAAADCWQGELRRSTKKTSPRSLIASRVGQALSVALQRAIACNILDYVHTKIPKGRKGTIAEQPGGADWDHDDLDPDVAAAIAAAVPAAAAAHAPAAPGAVLAAGVIMAAALEAGSALAAAAAAAPEQQQQQQQQGGAHDVEMFVEQ